MDLRERLVRLLVAPLRLLPGNAWGRFWWRYWERQGVSREEQWRLIEEADAAESDASER